MNNRELIERLIKQGERLLKIVLALVIISVVLIVVGISYAMEGQ